MPTPPPIPRAGRSPYGPQGEPKLFQDVSHRVQNAARGSRKDVEPTATTVDGQPRSPWPLLAGVALAGYVLGALVHRRA